MKDVFIVIGMVLAGIALIVGLMFGGLWARAYFAPRHEKIRREVFENTRSYNQAKLQQLSKYRYEYMLASEEEKEIIKSTIRHMFADYKSIKLPSELRSFLDEIKGGY